MAKKPDRCWAEGVSPCSGVISREHYISAGLFLGSMVIVEGLGGEGPREIAVEQLFARCLCEGHNAALSPLDLAAQDFANALRYLEDARGRYDAARLSDPPSHRLRVSGALLQRWAMKAAAAYAHVKHREVLGWRPSPAFVRATFGLEPLPDGCGLALLGRRGDRIEHVERWSLGFGKRPEDDEPTGMFLRFQGWRFVLSWAVPFAEWRALAIDGEIIDGRSLLLRFGEIKVRQGKQRHALRLSWDPDYTPSPEALRLRDRYRGSRRS